MKMTTSEKLGRLAALVALAVMLFSFFLVAARPWFLTWGATQEEAAGKLAGDELVNAYSQSTRAIEIDAPPSKVWPWLLQLGQDRGGFYSYELLENLVGTDMKNLDVLRPELQQWQVGDKLWMYPKDKLGGAGFAVLRVITPERALVFATRHLGTALTAPTDGSWAFVLNQLEGGRTRLLVRGRGARPSGAWLRAFDRFVFEPMHFVMERKMMEGIRGRSQGSLASPIEDTAEVVLFAACFAALIAAGVRLVRWPSARRGLAVVLATGMAFQLLTFVQPPWIIGVLIVLAISALIEYAEYA